MVWRLWMALLSLAWAGDPCPINVETSEFTPPWRDRVELLSALQTKRYWLGLTYGDQRDGLGLTEVSPGSPAERAGLRLGDRSLSVGGYVYPMQPTRACSLTP